MSQQVFDYLLAVTREKYGVTPVYLPYATVEVSGEISNSERLRALLRQWGLESPAPLTDATWQLGFSETIPDALDVQLDDLEMVFFRPDQPSSIIAGGRYHHVYRSLSGTIQVIAFIEPDRKKTEPSVLILFGKHQAMIMSQLHDSHFARQLLLDLAMFFSDIRGLHGAAVLARSKVLAFVGPSGSGKTTLALLAAAHGGRLVGNDVTLLRGRLAIPYRDLRMHVPVALLKTHQLVRGLFPGVRFNNSDSEVELRGDALGTIFTNEGGPLSAIIFPTLDRSLLEYDLSPVAPEPLVALLRANSFPFMAHIAAPLGLVTANDPWQEIADTVPGWRLRLGPSGSESAVRRLLGEAAV